MTYKLVNLGESAIIVDFGQRIDPDLNDFVVCFADFLCLNPTPGIVDIAPAYASVSIFFELSQQCTATIVQKWLTEQLETLKNTNLVKQKESITHSIPTVYDGEDLHAVAKQCGLSVNEVVELHAKETYRVYMLGFLPGFAYLGGLNNRLQIDRHPKPRQKVPAGSVAIAGSQTGIYSVESPGGWQIIGRTETKLFDRFQTPPSLLQAGDLVKFLPV